jgi:hypothetical protein
MPPEAANACVQTHGGFGFAEEYDVERKFRETRLYQVAPISTNLDACPISKRNSPSRPSMCSAGAALLLRSGEELIFRRSPAAPHVGRRGA